MAEEPSNHPACAACKYQRKKCAANCILRRHFPASNNDGFVAIHRLFGVANVTKMMREANSPAEQDEIAKSLYWEAALWVQDPVRGPYGAHQRLQEENRVLQEQVNRQRLLLMHNANGPPTINNFHGNMNMNMVVNANSNLVGPGNYVNGFVMQQQQQQQQQGNFQRPMLCAGPIVQFQGQSGQQGMISENNYNVPPRVTKKNLGFVEAMNHVEGEQDLGNVVTWQQQSYDSDNNRRSPKHDKMV